MIRLVASDMDGTLLNNQLQLSSKNIEAIKSIQENEVDFLIATGRDYEQAAPLLHEEGIHCPIIALNGAKFYDEHGTQVAAYPIKLTTVRNILSVLKATDIHVEMVTSEGIFSNNKRKRLEAFAAFIQKTNPGTSFENALNIAVKSAKQLGIRFVPSYDELLEKEGIEVYKLSAYTEKDPQTLIPIKKQLLSTNNQLEISSFHPSNLEIGHIHAQKGRMLSKYAAQKGFSPKEIMAIGDNLNDLSMLQWVEFSVAMMNGLPEIKTAAKHITKTNDEDGFAEAVHKFVLQPISTFNSTEKGLE